MNRRNLIIYALVIGIIQVLMNNFLSLSRLVDISLLPLLVFCLPGKQQRPGYLLAAFIFGLAIDFASSDTVGITSCALLPCVFARPLILKDHPDEKKLSRDLILSLTLLSAVYFLVYCLFDSAGTLRWNFLLLRWLCSTLVSALICIALKVTAVKEI